MYFHPGAVNWAFWPTEYAPDHGSRASARPIVAHSRFGVMAATTGQLRYAVRWESRYPRLMLRATAPAPVLKSTEPPSLAHSCFPLALALALFVQVVPVSS